jgi:hypothetical protein
MKHCFDESVLQAYVDGELSDERMYEITRHLAACSECERLVDNIQADLAVLSSALDAELGVAVPTAALRSRLDAAISQINHPIASAGFAPEASIWNRLSLALKGIYGSALVPAGALAALALVAVIGSIYLVNSSGVATGQIGRVYNGDLVPPPVIPPLDDTLIESGSEGASLQRNQGGHRTRRMPGTRTNISGPVKTYDQPLPGEKGYLNAIASLSGAVKQGSVTLKPTMVAEYERNLAIVNKAIEETRQTARQNPQDKDAVAFLYASYQSKVDLLNAVADQSLIARR